VIRFKTIRWKNFLSTGSAFTEIQLDRSPNTIIVGDNGAGKSTILDALCFGLFGRPFRKIKKDQLINSINGRETLVEVDFTFGGRAARVVRGIKPSKFEIYVDGALVDQVAASRDYQEYFERHVLKMNMKSFTQVIILGSSSFVPFMQLPTGARREVIEDLLDIQVFSVMSSMLRDMVQANDYQIHRNTTDVSSHEKMIAAEREREKAELEATTARIAELRRRETGLIEKISEIDRAVTELEAEATRITSETSTYGAIAKKMSDIDGLIGELVKKIKRVEKRRSFFSENDGCPTCGQEIGPELKDRNVSEADAEIAQVESGAKKLNQRRAALLEEINALDAVKAVLPKINGELNTQRSNHAIARREIDFVKEQIDRIRAETKSFSKTKLDQLAAELEVIRTEREELLRKQSMYGIATMMLKDGGIKAKIIRQYVPIINQLVNKYLAAMEFFVKFELNETFEERILSRHRDDFTYDSFSEGEKMRIDLALMFTWRAVARAKNSVSTNLLILDEVFDASLDGTGCDEFLKLIQSLENTNVFVISHKGDLLFDKFRSSIKFEKYANYSRIAA